MSGTRRASTRIRGGVTALTFIVAAVWVTSARVLFRWAGPGFSIVLRNGTLEIYGEGFYHTWDREWPAVQVSSGFNWGISWPRSTGPSYINVGPDTELAWTWFVAVPLWLSTAALLLVTGLLWLWPHRRRIPPGHCRKCGYDLTGNVSGRCPECGTTTNATRDPV